jgi:hypothetical protein
VLQLILKAIYFIYQGHYFPRRLGEGRTANCSTHLFYQGHYLPCVLALQY